MKLIIAMTLLVGWLVVEIKDFCFNGELTHSLDFGLLKITLILASIIVIIMVTFWINVLPAIRIRKSRPIGKQNVNELPEKTNDWKSSTAIDSKLYRKNSF